MTNTAAAATNPFRMPMETTEEAREAFVAVREVYLSASKIACTGAGDAAAFLVRLRDWCGGHTPLSVQDWVIAARDFVSQFLGGYTVRNALNPNEDWEWEQMERAAGRDW